MSFLRRLMAGISQNRAFRTQPGARVYAVGDIHGHLDLLDNLLQQIRSDIADNPCPAVSIVFLGDLIDRGPASAQVVDRLLHLQDMSARCVFLAGNHEEIFLRVLAAEPGVAYDWLGFGGDNCVESYGLNPSALSVMDEQAIADLLMRTIPARHIDFIKGFADTVRSGDYVFVHAGIRPGIPIDQQSSHDLRWIRNEFLNDGKDHGFMVIHGHTISHGVDERVNRIGIDTGAYQTGALTALALEDDRRWILTTGVRGASLPSEG